MIKVLVSHSAASNWVCSCPGSGYKGMIQNQIFSFADIIFFSSRFPDFNIFFNYIWSRTIIPSSNSSSTNPKFTIQKLFLNLKVFFKDISCCDTFYNLHHYWRRILLVQNQWKDVHTHHHYRLHRTRNSAFCQFRRIYISNNWLCHCLKKNFAILIQKHVIS
jgi:hypothetical protein